MAQIMSLTCGLDVVSRSDFSGKTDDDGDEDFN